MKKLVVLLFILSFSFINAQEADTLLNKWVPSAITGLNISQIAFSNWTQGGDNSLAWTLTGNLGLNRRTEDWNLRNELKIAYGRTKLGDAEFRTTDNELYLETVFSYKLGWAVDPYFSNTVRTQVTKGYNYKVNPAENIADFFDPGYITQSIGFTYDKFEKVKTRLGAAFQEVITNKFRQYSDDPKTVNEIESFKFETGIESVTDAEFFIAENLLLKSKLRLFSRFESLDIWDVRWDNTISAKINNWMNVNLAYLLIYEKAQSPKTQMKEALQIGIVYTFL